MRARPRLLLPTVVALGAVLLGGLTAAPASAAPVAPAAPAVPAVAGSPTGPLRPAADSTASVAGYVASLPTATRRALATTFTVPAVTCRRGTTAPLFLAVGLYGVTPGTTEFDYAAAGVTISCTQGVPFYEASVTAYPERAAGAVSPGDVLQVRLTTGASRSVAALTDVTSGGTFRVEDGGVAVNSAQASVQGGYDGQSFPKFDLVRFTGVRVDDLAIGAFTPTSFDQALDERILLTTSALTGRQNFVVRWRAGA